MIAASRSIIGKAPIVRAFYEQKDTGPLWSELFERVNADMTDAGAFMDLSIMLQVMGEPEQAVQCQAAALETARTYEIKNGTGDGVRVLVFMAAGDFMANTPIEFLLENSNTKLLLHYVDANTPDLSDVPPFDVAFVAISQSAENRAVLDHLARLLHAWHRPVMNRNIGSIQGMTRDGISSLFAGEKFVYAPPTVRVEREIIARLVRGETRVADVLPGQDFPIIIRPCGTHAGEGLEKISKREELDDFLARNFAVEFYLAPFIDYRGADGKFRKARIAFIDGQPFASHLGVSQNWMVHYLNADMMQHEDRRAEEAQWMESFDQDFARRHKRAFQTLHNKLGLDYFVIDCAELPDGRLLLFEAEIGMIVHGLDPTDLFAYKRKAMAKVFAAFESTLARWSKAADPDMVCAHTGKPALFQRTDSDCLTCAIAMFTGLAYEDVEAMALGCDLTYPVGGPMSHSIMRGVANKAGLVLLSSIYMLWDRPAIIGMHSPNVPGQAHAIFLDGEKFIDPSRSGKVDRAYVDRYALEFTQRANDLERLITLEISPPYQAAATFAGEI